MHPGVGNKKDTLANYVRYYLESKGEYDDLVDRAGIVHRLDKGVSGLVVLVRIKSHRNF
jgi:23S rRNA-/tRNA-specific pseudouridylate synthase